MDPVFRFFSVATASQSAHKERGSKFLGFLYPVQSTIEVQERLQELKKAYPDASHHCYAWVIGPDKTQYKAHDDGEPRHSAGDPILGQIRSKNLSNVLIVVVRYFGGTKLGVSGLIAAYREAAQQAIAQTSIVEQFVTETLNLTYAYADTAAVMKLISGFNIEIIHQSFSEYCRVMLRYRREDEIKLWQALDTLVRTSSSLKVKKEAPG